MTSLDDVIKALPRTLYYADVRAQDSGAGSSLIYRLLKYFPSEKLLIINPASSNTPSGKQLVNARGIDLRETVRSRLISRLGQSRWSSTARRLQWQSAAKIPIALKTKAARFQPEAVLSVAHGSAWRTAFHYAQKQGIPFHLIVHDSIELALHLRGAALVSAKEIFRRAYCEAEGIYCVSPYMNAYYASEYGRSGVVLLPGRDCDNAVFPAKPADYQKTPLAIGYAGALYNPGYKRLVGKLGRLAKANGYRVVVFGPDAPAKTLENHEDFEYRGNLPSEKLIPALNQAVDILFCPQSFDVTREHAMSINFPSKLADYTAAGLPLLIWGPASCSSVNWALEHPGLAMVVSEDDDNLAAAALSALKDGPTRQALAEKCLEEGIRHFSADAAFQTLAIGLLGRRQTPEASESNVHPSLVLR